MRSRRGWKVLVRLAALAGGAALLAGCNNDLNSANGYRAYAPIPDDTAALMTTIGTRKDAPMLIRAFKKEAEFEVWKQGADGRYVLLKTFPMCRWSGQLGPKVREGDRQVPEGFYSIVPGSMNPNSAYYLSFNVGYPNAYDRALGHTGGSIMVHGICSSAGCFSMTDKQIEEIYAITREAFAGGQRSIQMQSFPFRMTAENLAKYRLDPNIAFWRELKRGSDYFEATKSQPPVGVCNKHYVFAKPKDGASFDAESVCPPLEESAEIKAVLTQKSQKDDAEVATLVGKGVRPVRTVYADGGQNPSFAGKVIDVSRPDALAQAPIDVALDDTPKTKPVRKGMPALVEVAAAKTKAAAGTTVVAATAPKPPEAGAPAPATFAAAPSAYAKEEPKSTASALFDKVISFGGLRGSDSAADTSDATATIAPPASETPQKQAGAKSLVRPQAALRKPLKTGDKPAADDKPADTQALNRLNPDFKALVSGDE